MASSKLTSKWQITVPKAVRRRLSLKIGDQLAVSVDAQGGILLRRAGAASLPGFVGSLSHLARRRTVSIEEMRKAVLKRAAGRHRRER